MRSGEWYDGEDADDGPLEVAGSYGFYWSSRAYSDISNGYHLELSSDTTPFSSSGRYVAFSLRCLSTVLDR